MRTATVQDSARIMEFLTHYYLENQKVNPYPVEFNFPMCRWFVSSALSDPRCICFLTDDGFIFGEISCTWFGENFIGRVIALYVKPEARNGFLAIALVRRFFKEAKTRGALYSVMETYVSANGVDSFLEAQGCKLLGGVYAKRL